jgi:O-antigen ligase
MCNPWALELGGCVFFMWNKLKQQSMESVIAFAVIIFMAMQFCMPSFFVFSFWFYLVVAPSAVYWVVKHKYILQDLWQSWNCRFLVLLVAYVIIHALCFNENGAMNNIRYAGINSVFLLTMMVFHRNLTQKQLLDLIRLMLLVVVVCGVISIVNYVINTPETKRLVPIGQNNHEILGANIYSLFALMGLGLWRNRKFNTDKILVVAAFGVSGILILLTQSRGPLIAFGLTTAAGLMMLRYYKILIFGIIFAAIIIADFYLYHQIGSSALAFDGYYEHVISALNRKSHRLEIWQLAWELIQKRPITGYGMQATFPYGYAGVNPHNLFISTWYYTGVVGFVLLIATTIFALVNLYKNSNQTLGFVGFLLLLHGVIACLTDQGQLMKTPSPLWFIFWWGIAISCVTSMQQTNSTKLNSPQLG